MVSSVFDLNSSAILPAYRADSELERNLDFLGSYRVETRLAVGGMGSVYRALDLRDNRTVALKVLDPQRIANPTLIERFKVEAQAAMRLRHENIVHVYAAGTCRQLLYIAMEFIEGASLYDIIAQERVLGVERSLYFMQDVTRGLAHAAELGVVHRDIKPSNILIRKDGIAKLTDFGLARVIDETAETSLTHEGMTVGTVEYIAPEQARDSRAADVRSDIYSLGCTWFHMLTGAPPFSQGSLREKMRAHVSSLPPDPRASNPAIPDGVVAVLNRMLAKDAGDRYQTAHELLRDLEIQHLLRAEVTDDDLRGLLDGAEDIES
jgi:serine/threonine-protein kinase